MSGGCPKHQARGTRANATAECICPPAPDAATTDHDVARAMERLHILRVTAEVDGRPDDARWLDDAANQLRRARFHERENYARWETAGAVIERLGIKAWQPEDGDKRCQECGRPNPTWYADDAVWNEVMGSENGILCPTCFAAKSADVTWHLVRRTPPPQVHECGDDCAIDRALRGLPPTAGADQ